MASLSLLVYSFRNQFNDSAVCDLINNNHNYTEIFANHDDDDDENNEMLPDALWQRIHQNDIVCHWYHHDRIQGTQVMLVSSSFIALSSSSSSSSSVLRSRNNESTTTTSISSTTRIPYHAVVFAGTDDLRTSLTDANVLTKPFGDTNINTTSNNTTNNITLPDPRIRVHAGFNNAVFQQDIYIQIEERLKQVITVPQHHSPPPTTTTADADADAGVAAAAAATNTDDYPLLYATGHSLGAANAVLTTVAWNWRQWQQQQQEPQQQEQNKHWWHRVMRPWWRRHENKQPYNYMMKTINFGCPRIGNVHWRDFLHGDHPAVQHMAIWRFVLGWDLVPRLPEFFSHEGHTIQLYKNKTTPANDDSGDDENDDDDDDFHNGTALAYYQHYGNETLGMAGVPPGWYAKPFIWVPGALSSHHIHKYWHVLHGWAARSKSASTSKNLQEGWVHSFVPVDNDSNDDRPPNVDDDFWINPPDDDAAAAAAAVVDVRVSDHIDDSRSDTADVGIDWTLTGDAHTAIV